MAMRARIHSVFVLLSVLVVVALVRAESAKLQIPESGADFTRALQSKDPKAQLAAAILMTEVVQKSEKADLLLRELREVGQELPRVLDEASSEQLQLAVIEAIGHVRPRRVLLLESVNLAAPAFQKSMTSRSPSIRQATARSIGSHVRRTLAEAQSNSSSVEQRSLVITELLLDSIAFSATLIVALNDTDVGVRLAGLEATHALLASVNEVQRLIEVEESAGYEPLRNQLVPLARELAQLIAAGSKHDPNRELTHQLVILGIVEQAAELVRTQPARGAHGLLANPRLAPDAAKAATLIKAELVRLERSLEQALAHTEPSVRLAALDALENYGTLARGLTPAVIKSASDADRFVRWSAARVLPRMDPDGDAASVHALGRMLFDTDHDVRLVALDSLQKLGPKNSPALPALERLLVRPDAELKVAALRVLESTGPTAKAIVPTVVHALKDADVRVRRQAPVLLGSLGAEAKSALPGLQDALSDADAEVRQAASRAVLKIVGQ
jgi:HEAT repeat protein